MKPTIIVAGLGRCGSTMTMHMLAAAGVPCLGQPPGYEAAETRHDVEPSWLLNQGGSAVKILDPQRVLNFGKNWVQIDEDVKVIWLERRHAEQAKSIAKMLRMVEGLDPRNRHIKRIHKGLDDDRRRARYLLQGWCWPTITLRFEETLARPLVASQAIARFLAPDFELDTNAMAAAVRPRSPLCAKDLSMELTLLKEAEGQ
jgi:hypothetical protein